MYMLLFNTGPDMTVLQKFKCKDGKEMNIIVQTAPNYKKIGTFLLNDENGQIVEGIARQLPFPLELTMTRIYEKWLLGGGTWEKLVKCLKDCGLNVLAGDIEDGLKRFSGRLLSSVVLDSLTLGTHMQEGYCSCLCHFPVDSAHTCYSIYHVVVPRFVHSFVYIMISYILAVYILAPNYSDFLSL